MLRRSAEGRAFELYLRHGLIVDPAELEEHKFNPYHDPADGRFTFAPGYGSLAPRGAGMTAREHRAGAATGQSRRNPAPPRVQQARRPRPPGLSDETVAAAQSAHRKYGIPASVTLAQFGLESGWGQRMPPGSNNPFGIKARPGEPYVEQPTWEEDRLGRKRVVSAKFKKYDSLAEAFDDHARVLLGPRYRRARSATSSSEFARALTGVYATDHNYGTKLIFLIQQNRLGEFDKK